MAKEIAEEYASSLADLTVNSKPLINMLTILAEENVEHAGVIVDTVEKHLEKVQPDVKLPVLYLVDSIIKNVGGAYTQKFSNSIVNMFTKTFKQVDEKTRSQMFKLRETWHDVLPATKLYQLDVKVNLIDPAWPIQAQPHQANIHVNPNFLKKPVPTTSTVVPEDAEMRSILAKKEQELLMLQKKKIEMELEATRRQLELAEKTVKKPISAAVAPLVTPVMFPAAPAADLHPSVKQRLGPPVNQKLLSGARIAPVSTAMVAAARRDPRLARAQHLPPAHPPPAPAPAPALAPPPALAPATIAPNVFDIQPLPRHGKRKNVITIDVKPETLGEKRDPRRRDPRNNKRDDRMKIKDRRKEDRNRRLEERKRDEEKAKVDDMPNDLSDGYLNKLADIKKINKLPPIPKLNKQNDDKKEDVSPSPTKRRKDIKDRKAKKDNSNSSSSDGLSPEKRFKKKKDKKESMEVDDKQEEVVAFKELKNYHKERYRRNRDKSRSPEKVPEGEETPVTIAQMTLVESKQLLYLVTILEPFTDGYEPSEAKDVDLRVLPTEVVAPVVQKRPSTDSAESISKKSKLEKFDILFGNEDVDLRQLPSVDDTPSSPKADDTDTKDDSPRNSPREKDWNAVKDKSEDKRTPSKLDLVRAKLAEATGRKDRLGRPYRFTKSPSVEKNIRNSISSEDTDLRVENDDEVNKETISLILSQAKEHFKDGKMDKNQYNTLMFQVMQLNEKLKLKEAKQRESLEISKRKLHRVRETDEAKVASPKSSPGTIEHNRFGDIDERVPPSFLDAPVNNNDFTKRDSDMRQGPLLETPDGPGCLPRPPMPPMFLNNFPPNWRGPRPREEFGRRGIVRPFFRGKFEPRVPRFEQRFQGPTPKFGMYQGDSPIPTYHFCTNPPPLGHPGVMIPETDYRAIEFIEQDPMKTIDIDGIPREIRFYGETAIIMLDWDDPREIKFLPGSRRINFDNKDSVVLNFNEGDKTVEIDDQTFQIRYGAPTRELYINQKWFECVFGGPPTAIVIEKRTRIIKLEGPVPQVDIGKEKRTDLVAGKINLIVDAQHMFPIFLDAKPQLFLVEGHQFIIRFVDGLRTVLINEVPFLVEFGGLPRPIFIGRNKHFIRFSVLPRNVKPGYADIVGMEGRVAKVEMPVFVPEPVNNFGIKPMDVDQELVKRPETVASPEADSQGGLDMLASVMPTKMAPASSSVGYSVAQPLFNKTDKIPGLETPSEEKPPLIPALGNINDLFAKLVATGIINVPEKEEKKEDVKEKKEDKTIVHKVDLLKPETLKQKQPALVAKLYGGMQCSGCGARFPPEHTVRYSQHLDWHFRQNRRERDSARRAHSRHWHYDLADWVQYEEIEDLEEREKSWFETGGAAEAAAAAAAGVAAPEPAAAPPSVAAGGAPPDAKCCLCGDRFHQFYNEDQEEWHLSHAVRDGDNVYHPLCFDDYKASLAKETEKKEEMEPIVPQPTESSEPIEVDADNSQSDDDDESVVEVPAKPEPEPVEITELEEDDDEDAVILSTPAIEQVDVNDGDTDDETIETRKERDKAIDFTKIKIKQEPKDPDDEPIITAEEEAILAAPHVARAAPTSTIDGNIEPSNDINPVPIQPANIRINITKTLPTAAPIPVVTTEEPPPPGEVEEIEPEYVLKDTMKDIEFCKQPPVRKGDELSGLCCLM